MAPYDRDSFLAGLAAGLVGGVNKHEVIKQIVPYLTFSSPSSFTLAIANNTKNWDGKLEYSTDTQNWTEWDGTTTLSSGSDNKLYLRGTNNHSISNNQTSYYNPQKRFIIVGSRVSCTGDIRTILDYKNPENAIMDPYCFNGLFYNCSALIKAPELPSLSLDSANECYSQMFYGCLNLNEAPKLPATTLETSCYSRMFSGCTSLQTAPELPATKFTASCYYYMFSGCISLVDPPIIRATELTIGSIPDSSCCRGMFNGCTSLKKLSKLPLKNLSRWCYRNMYKGCEKIKLSIVQTEEYSTPYIIPYNGTGTESTDSLLDMFTDTGGTFTGTPEINTTYYTSNEII